MSRHNQKPRSKATAKKHANWLALKREDGKPATHPDYVRKRPGTKVTRLNGSVPQGN